ncbi:MAG: bL21 family ribosomal protein [Waddliaceae bacterium]
MGSAVGPKVVSLKYKPRQHQQKKWGHRQKYTRVKITEIGGEGKVKAKPKAPAKKAEAKPTPKAKPKTAAKKAEPKAPRKKTETKPRAETKRKPKGEEGK